MDTRWKPAVTVAAVIEHEGRFLIIEEDTADGLRLNQPAGHLEAGESLVDAFVRETLEESGYTVRPTGLLGIYMWRFPDPVNDPQRTYLRFAFVGEVIAHDPSRPLDAGIQRAFWLDADELRAQRGRHRSGLLQECVDDYLAAKSAGRPWLPLEAIHTHPNVSELAP